MKKYIASGGGNATRDPYVLLYENKYYRCFASEGNTISLACAESLAELAKVRGQVVYTAEPNTPWSRELWAPELHVIDGKCYIYVACDDGENKNHRMYVLTNGSENPEIPYRMLGKLTDKTDKWAIDGTVFNYNGELYTVWSGWDGDVNICQNLYIAKMASPTEIATERVMISTPEYDWEKMDCVGDGKGLPTINEGPCYYERDGEAMLIYSASGSWANNYCLGILRLVGDDPLNPAAWEKQPFPAMSQADGYNGPGHCSVFCDGKDDYIAYHVYDDGKSEGWQNVHAEVVKFEINDGKIMPKD